MDTETELLTNETGNIYNSSLEVRLSYIKQIQYVLSKYSWNDYRAGPIKKIFRSLLTSFLDEYYLESCWTDALLNVIEQSCQIEFSFDFLDFLVSCITDTMLLEHKFSLLRSRVRLIEMCCFLVQKHKVVIDNTENLNNDTTYSLWLNTLLNIIGEHCDLIIENTSNKSSYYSRTNCYVTMILQHFQQSTKFFDLCTQIWMNQANKQRPGTYCILLEFIRLHKTEQLSYTASKQVVLEFYIKRLQSLTKQQSIALSSSVWDKLIASLTTDDWINTQPSIASIAAATASTNDNTTSSSSESLEAVMIKALKKAPESSSYVVSKLCSQINKAIDMSNFISTIAAASIVKMLKSSDDAVKNASMLLLSSLIQRCFDPIAYEQMLVSLCEGYLGKGAVGAGGLMSSQLHIKACFLWAIQECAMNVKSLGNAATMKIALIAVTSLQTMIEKEIDSNIRFQIAIALGTWFSLCDYNDAKLLPFYKAIKSNIEKYGSNNPLCISYLLSIAVMLNNSADCSSDLLQNTNFDVTGPCIAVLLKEASKKATTNIGVSSNQMEAILSLGIIVRMFRFSSSALSSFESSKLWSIFTTSNSFLYSPHLLQQLTIILPTNSVLKTKEAMMFNLSVGMNEHIGTCMLHREVIKFFVTTMALVISEGYPEVSQAFTGGSFATKKSTSKENSSSSDSSTSNNSSVASTTGLALASTLCGFMTLSSIDRLSRETIYENIRLILSRCPELKYLFLKALWMQLNNIATTLQKYHIDLKNNYKSNDEVQSNTITSKVPYVPCHALWINALNCVVNVNNDVSVQSFEKVITLCMAIISHPYLSGSCKKAMQIWSKTHSVFNNHSAALLLSSKTLANSISSIILENASSELAASRETAYQMLYILAHDRDNIDGGTIISNNIVPQLILSTKNVSEELFNLSPYELLVYSDINTAIKEAIESKVAKGAAVSASDMVITNADRKKATPRSARRGNFGADNVIEDEDWAERIKQEKALKIQQSKHEEGSLNEDVTKRIYEERLIIHQKVEKASYILAFWNAFLSADVNIVRPSLTQLIAYGCVGQLLTTPLISHLSLDCISNLIKYCLENEYKPLNRDISNSLRIVETCLHKLSPKGEYNEEESMTAYRMLYAQSGPVLRILQSLLVILSRAKTSVSPISSCTFMMLFPILRGILYIPHTMPGSEHTFHLLSSIWPSDAIFTAKLGDVMYLDDIKFIRAQRANMIDICLRVLSRPQRTEPSADKVLLRVATQLSASESSFEPEEWNLFTSDIGLLNSEAKVRLAVLQIMQTFIISNNCFVLNPLSETFIWLLKFDSNEGVSSSASELWGNRTLKTDYFSDLKPLLSHRFAHIRLCSAKAIAGAILSVTQENNMIINSLCDMFRCNLPVQMEKLKGAGGSVVLMSKKGTKGSDVVAIPSQTIARKANSVEDKNSSIRIAITQVFAALGSQSSNIETNSTCLDEAIILGLIEFILQVGVIDTHMDVRSNMLSAGSALVGSFGNTLCGPIMMMIEKVLALEYTGERGNEETIAAFDNRNAAAVVLLGVIGRHLQKDDPAIETITQSLVKALNTPSESVQRSVADCLAPLVQLLKTSEVSQKLLKQLIETTLEASTYGERRGAAFGLSAFVKGLGISSLKQHDIVPRLKEACASGSINNRQGALFALECLSDRLGLLFEPYIASIIDVLLKSFSHSSDHVRDAAQTAARVIMNKLSAHGVKQVLTPILQSLPEESAWKSRQEGIRLLGMMAHCAPKQLATCLPQVVEALMQAGSDPHPKVKESAKAALSDISSVIKNPEVSRLSPILLAAIGDPANKTKEALEALLECEFMHSIDAPSLALLVPILARALKDRGADIKRKSAAITGNMVTMVSDAKVLSPYLTQVLPGLQDCLLDPIPDVRATSAKAIGSLFVGMGETNEELQKLIPWLSNMLSTDTSPVERSGAAQGLAEICGTALTEERVQQVLQTVLRLQFHSSSGREGLLWFLSFLPATLNENFAAYISITLPVILSGLSDENDGVREVALRAGQVIVYKLGISHTSELIPSLTDGMFQEDWRIRLSSVQLLGELLCMVGDIRATNSGDGEDDGEYDEVGNNTTRVGLKIRQHIGENESYKVLASLYIVRFDLSMNVRQSALNTWKSIVSNSPRTLLQIMPVLVLELIEKLASPSEMLRTVAGASLGDIVSKLGDKVLPTVIKPLREGLRSSSVSQRQGVCSGLSEILNACSKKQAEDYITILIPALQQALCDPSLEVCNQAARAFMTLFKTIGVKAIDQIVPALLQSYGSGDSEESILALQGLREIVQLRPRDLLEYLLPTLMVSPVTCTSAKALGAIMSVAGPQLHHYFVSLIPTLVHELSITDDKVQSLQKSLDSSITSLDSEQVRFEALKEASISVMGAIVTEGVHNLINDISKQIEHESSVKRRRWGCWLLGQFFTHSQASFTDYIPVFLKFLLSRVAEFDIPLLQSVSDALQSLSNAVPTSEFLDHIDFIRNCITSTASAARHRTGTNAQLYNSVGEFVLPLFTIPKSLDPLFTILLHGLMNGSLQTREISAEAIGELALMADVNVLKPLLIKTTGPLIRVVGDRFPSNVKATILQTLCVLMDKGGVSLKAFVPQLQTTFVKALNDPARDVRTKGGIALGRLMPLTIRIDPLLIELVGLSTKADSNAIKVSAIEAIGIVLLTGGNKSTSSALDSVKTILVKNLSDEDEVTRAIATKSLSRLVWFLDSAAVMDIAIDLIDSINNKNNNNNTSDISINCGRILGIGALLQGAGHLLIDVRDELYQIISIGCKDDRAIVNLAAVSALGMILTVPGGVSNIAIIAKKINNTIDIVTTSSTNNISIITKLAEERKAELKISAQSVVHTFATLLSNLVSSGSSSEIKARAIIAIKQGAKFYFGAAIQHIKEFAPALILALKDIDLRVKYCAERSLKHLCEGMTISEATSGLKPGQSSIIVQYLNNSNNSTDKETVVTLKDYMRRILVSLPIDSDDEAGYE